MSLYLTHADGGSGVELPVAFVSVCATVSHCSERYLTNRCS